MSFFNEHDVPIILKSFALSIHTPINKRDTHDTNHISSVHILHIPHIRHILCDACTVHHHIHPFAVDSHIVHTLARRRTYCNRLLVQGYFHIVVKLVFAVLNYVSDVFGVCDRMGVSGGFDHCVALGHALLETTESTRRLVLAGGLDGLESAVECATVFGELACTLELFQ